ncbi:MAG: translation elongation factor Ts [Candidatus Daviesbacteria bacterium]|nr:translation elongation factor Ts [Candidatus Daviesbacteria bacterium]
MNIEDIKKLRQDSGAGIADCKEALKESNGDMEKAKQWLKKKGFDKAKSKAGREVKAGLVETYSHGGKVGVMVELLCETDFVARTPDFKNLAHELCLQIASMAPKNVADLLKQVYIRDEKMTVEDLVKSVIGKLGENIIVKRFERIVLGE